MTSYTATMSIKVTLLNWLANFLQIQSEIKSSRHGLTENLEQLICMLSLVSNATKQAYSTMFHHNSA